MPTKNSQVDLYLQIGCGRCPLGGTPECKVHDWQKELKLLRSIVLECGLTEELKWKMPCYTSNGRNIAMIGAFKDHASISFFKGSLMADPNQVLEKPGENSQSARMIRFKSSEAVRKLSPVVKELIAEAVRIEEMGMKVDFKAKHELEIPIELESKFVELPALRIAWDKLTPGRQRGFVLFFTAAKQSQTRVSRIEKWIPAILEGRGMHD